MEGVSPEWGDRMGLFTTAPIDTSPGASSPFAPVEGWQGGREDYLALLRRRYQRMEYRQAFHSAAREAARGELQVVGPFAETVCAVIEQIAERYGEGSHNPACRHRPESYS